MTGYAYVSNNPVNAIDPTGLMEVSSRRWWQTIGGAIVGFGAGVAILATSPAWLPAGAIAAAGTVIVAGTAAGAATGVTIELATFETDCHGKIDFDAFGAAKAGAKGGGRRRFHRGHARPDLLGRHGAVTAGD
jgi:hypothetical protein